MKDFATYLSTAPVLTLVSASFMASLLIEVNRFFPDALVLSFLPFLGPVLREQAGRPSFLIFIVFFETKKRRSFLWFVVSFPVSFSYETRFHFFSVKLIRGVSQDKRGLDLGIFFVSLSKEIFLVF